MELEKPILTAAQINTQRLQNVGVRVAQHSIAQTLSPRLPDLFPQTPASSSAQDELSFITEELIDVLSFYLFRVWPQTSIKALHQRQFFLSFSVFLDLNFFSYVSTR